MPGVTRTAFRIYVTALLLCPVVGYFDPMETPPLPPDAIPILIMAVLMFVLPFLGLFAFFVFKAYRGRNWARLVLAAVTIGGVSLYADYIMDQFARSQPVATLSAILALAQIVAVALLFTSSSNAWYRTKRAHVERVAA